MLVHLHNPKAQSGGDDSKERVQSMQSYGMDDWEDWKDYLEPDKCLMEHRTGDLYNSKSCCIDLAWPHHQVVTSRPVMLCCDVTQQLAQLCLPKCLGSKANSICPSGTERQCFLYTCGSGLTALGPEHGELQL